MSHEPECPPNFQQRYSAEECHSCDRFRAAFDRGRASVAAPLRALLDDLYQSESKHVRPIASKLRHIVNDGAVIV